MRIALFTDGVHPLVVGGIQRHSFYLCKFLARKGVKIDLYHFVENDEVNENEFLELFSDQERNNINSILINYKQGGRLPGHHVREAYVYSETVYREFRQQKKVDFVYSKSYVSWKYIEEKRKGVELPPIGVKLHGYEIFQLRGSARDYLNWMTHRKAAIFNTRYADIVFSYGGKITEIILKHTQTPRDRIVEIPTGIDPVWLNIKASLKEDNTIRLVYLGRYEKRKGIHFINKWVKTSKANFKLTFIGPIPENKKVNDSRVEYLGMIHNTKKLQKILANQDVLLCPSLAEGMPNVIMEGMASSCAIVATNVGANSILVDVENGWLIEGDNYTQFFTAMSNVLSTSLNEMNVLKQRSKDKVLEKFTWDIVADQVLEVVNQKIEST